MIINMHSETNLSEMIFECCISKKTRKDLKELKRFMYGAQIKLKTQKPVTANKAPNDFTKDKTNAIPR